MANSRSHKNELRDYVGYEDYTPSGRASINKFNEEGGPDTLSPKTSQKAYDKAAASARAAGDEAYREGKQGSPSITGKTHAPRRTYK